METEGGFKALLIVAAVLICAVIYGVLSIFAPDKLEESKPLITIETIEPIPEEHNLDVTITCKRKLILNDGEIVVASIKGCEYIFYRTSYNGGAEMRHFEGCQGIVHKVRNHEKN